MRNSNTMRDSPAVPTSATWRAVSRLLRDHSVGISDTADLESKLTRYRELVEARNAAMHGRTAADAYLVPPTKISETVIDALVQTQDAYALRRRAHENHSQATDDHQSIYLDEWQYRAKILSECSHEEMLSSLWDSGLSWRDIARILKVSIGAVQKWRAGERMAPNNFARLRDFVAAYNTVAAHKPDIDIASWLDIPILTDVPVTPRDLWTRGQPDGFFEYALGDRKAEAALNAYDPEWRQRYRNDGFESFVGEDGQLGVRTESR